MKNAVFFILGGIVLALLQALVIEPLKAGTFDAAVVFAIVLGLIAVAFFARDAVRRSGPPATPATQPYRR